MKKLLALAIIVLLVSSCATVKKVATEVEQVAKDVKDITGNVAVKKYIVVKGDCLWDIAAKKSIYGDPFLWPLLHKANRDQIQDPDVIEIGQELIVKMDYSQSTIHRAKKEAQERPLYKR